MTSGRTRAVLLGAAASALVGLVVLARWSTPAAPATAALDAGGSGTRPFRADLWPSGEVATYTFSWASNAGATMQGGRGELGTSLTLRGDLTLRSYGPRDGAVLLGIRLPKIEEAHGEALGKPLGSPDALAADLTAAEVAVLVEPDGHIRELSYSEASSAIARAALRGLALELAAVVGSTAGGRSVVETSLGRARVEPRDAGPGVSSATRIDYEELDVFGGEADDLPQLTAQAAVTLDAQQRIERIASTEELSAVAEYAPLGDFRASTSLVATLRTRERVAASDPPKFAPGSVRAAPGIGSVDRRASLERRAQGVTRESVIADINKVAFLTRPRQHEWIWRDSAWLELHPEESRAIVAAAMADPTDNLRAATFDIMVIAGTDKGQEAMVEALKTLDPSSDQFEILVQRLAHLARPTAATIAYVEGVYGRAPTPSTKRSCAYTLGALARHSEDDDNGTTRRLVGRFERELAEATTNEVRVTTLGALGNAGQPSSAPAVVRHAQSPEEDVRYAVAAALRRMESRVAIDVLKELLTDERGQVATAAGQALTRMRLDSGDWEQIASSVRTARVPDAAHSTLLGLVANKRDADPEALRVLVAMVASENVSLEMRGRAASMLGGDASDDEPAP